MQTGRKPLSVPAFSPAKLAEITSAVRALCVIYNTSHTYETTHQVFQKAVEERVPVFRTALSGINELPLFFAEGQIRVGALPLEPGSGMFQKLSHEFETMGISSISILPAVSAEDIRKLMKIVTSKSEEMATRGLQHFLSQEAVTTIVENKVKTQIVSKDAPDTSKEPSTKAGRTGTRRSRREEPVTAWDIDAQGETPHAAEQEEVTQSHRFRSFVKGAIGALARNEAHLGELVDIITTEFEHRLNEKVEEVRRTSERRVRRLENIKDLILQELENHNVAALVLDTDLKILSVNRLGREIIGDMSTIKRDSPLGAFVVSQQERRKVEVNGVVRTAHLLTSTSRASGELLMLLSLE